MFKRKKIIPSFSTGVASCSSPRESGNFMFKKLRISVFYMFGHELTIISPVAHTVLTLVGVNICHLLAFRLEVSAILS